MPEVLRKLDAAPAEKRDMQRYVVQAVKEAGLETKLEPVRFRRQSCHWGHRVRFKRDTGRDGGEAD